MGGGNITHFFMRVTGNLWKTGSYGAKRHFMENASYWKTWQLWKIGKTRKMGKIGKFQNMENWKIQENWKTGKNNHSIFFQYGKNNL